MILQKIVDNLETVVMLFDRDLCLNYINPAGEMLFSASSRNMVGQKACDLMSCPEEIVGNNLRNALHNNQPFTEREIRMPLPDGTDITVDLSIIPLMENEDNNDGLLVEIQILDRHARITREEQLLAQQTMTRDLVRGMAHEIKNPLGGIRGAAQLLEAELNTEELKEYTQVIISETNRLQLLVDRMLGPNKLPKNRLLNIHDVLEHVRILILAETKNVPIWRDYDPSIPDIFGDQDQLIQAILNIVRNAERALSDVAEPVITLRTRIARQMTLGSQRHRLVARIDIIDNGPGVAEEIKDKLFFPMVSNSEGGVGVGLSISQTLINKHGGLIECRSDPGNTVFTIWLPLEVKHATN